MDKHIYDSKNGLCYELQGDYYIIPCIVASETDISIGIWGRRRQRYLREHRNGLYTAMLLSGKLTAHLRQTDEQANELYALLIRQLAAQAGITEQLKVADEIAWVQQMNTVAAQAQEIINAELIHT